MQPMQPVGAQMKTRNPLGVWLGLPIITFGIYPIVWFFKIHEELNRFDPRIQANATNALLSILFGWITLGIWPLIMWIKLAGHIADAQSTAGLQRTCSTGLGLVLGLIGFGALYYQLELNKVTGRYAGAPVGAQVPLAA